MSAIPADAFLAKLRESGLLRMEQVMELGKRPEARTEALARFILDKGWLTKWQMAVVAAGRAKDLRVGAYLLLEKVGEGGTGVVVGAMAEPRGSRRMLRA